MYEPSKEELEQLFSQVREGWTAKAEDITGEGDWKVDLFEAGHQAGYARLSFKDEPPRCEWETLSLMPPWQNSGVFTDIFPIFSPWFISNGYEAIVIRDWMDPAPFISRGFQFMEDPAEITNNEVLVIDLRDPDRPSKEWVVSRHIQGPPPPPELATEPPPPEFDPGANLI